MTIKTFVGKILDLSFQSEEEDTWVSPSVLSLKGYDLFKCFKMVFDMLEAFLENLERKI